MVDEDAAKRRFDFAAASHLAAVEPDHVAGIDEQRGIAARVATVLCVEKAVVED